jgi:oligoendopeptidase F
MTHHSRPQHLSNAHENTLPVWDLAHLYPSPTSAAYTLDMRLTCQACESFADDYRALFIAPLPHDEKFAHTLAEAIQRFETLQDQLGRLQSYAYLTYATHLTDPQVIQFYTDTSEKLTAAYQNLVFFTLGINTVPDPLFYQLSEHPQLKHWAPWLEDIRYEKPHQLEDQVEKLFLEHSVVTHAWVQLFDETLARLRFGAHNHTLEETLSQFHNKDPNVRKKTAQDLVSGLKPQAHLMSLVINTIAKEQEISNRWHKFEHVADSRHCANRIERDVVDAFVSAVVKAYPRLSHRYYALKARWLGKEKLDYWDRNAPLPEADETPVPWSVAVQEVLASYRDFSPRMADIGEKFFTGHWIDVGARPGKASGAFSHPTVPSAHPYILLNYQGKLRDVLTLSHELGHGIHQVLAADQGALMAPTSLIFAETASIFGEALTFKRILQSTSNPLQKRAFLAAKVEDALNTVVRQVAFFCFEKRLHTERKSGVLTQNRIEEIWLEEQRASLGPAIILGPGYEVFWTYVSHFIHAPFYVYAYGFGACLVNSLYGLYEKMPEGFEEKYIALLSAGGTKRHDALLAPFGLNARDPSFWENGLNVIENMINELEHC